MAIEFRKIAIRPACLAILLFFCLTGCASPTQPATPTLAQTETSQPAILTIPSTVTSSPFLIKTSTATITPSPALQLCSPLAGIEIAELPQLMTGDLFKPPLPGRDDGHHGVDFAFYRHGTLTTMLGLPVEAILAGRVAAVIADRKPYGNAIIIETPLQGLPIEWSGTIKLPTSAPTVQPDPRLTCPKPQSEPWLVSQTRSLYHLYAHLNKLPDLKVGQQVACGEVIGEVGTTGNSVNPHLHLETRLGPSGVSFSSLGYYDTRLNEEERSNYCTWRVSGWFQMFDPMNLFRQVP
jgi:hypothetical protein